MLAKVGSTIALELMQADRLRWYAAYTLSRHERTVADRLEEQGIESYLPCYTSQRNWNGRRVALELPLFPGYVFIRMRLHDKSRILSRPGIIRIVSFNGAPAVLSDEEVDRLRTSLQIWKATPYPFLSVGKQVRITSGPFAGLHGRILRRKGQLRLVVTLEQIQSAMVLELSVEDAQLAC